MQDFSSCLFSCVLWYLPASFQRTPDTHISSPTTGPKEVQTFQSRSRNISPTNVQFSQWLLKMAFLPAVRASSCSLFSRSSSCPSRRCMLVCRKHLLGRVALKDSWASRSRSATRDSLTARGPHMLRSFKVATALQTLTSPSAPSSSAFLRSLWILPH